MAKTTIVGGTVSNIVLADSITSMDSSEDDHIVISGSHGGVSAGEHAAKHRARLVVFNDAGVGKDEAGIASLGMLQDLGIAAVTVAHWSARIGSAQDTWSSGIISHVNEAARALGFAPGQSLSEAASKLAGAAS